MLKLNWPTWLSSHPFAVEAFFECSIVLTFAIPKNEIEPLLPPCLTPDTFEDEKKNVWAFIAIAIVDTKDLRPKGFPKFMGKNFILTGYRIFVRYTNNAGKNLRGLYILKSQTNKKAMEYAGNIFTKYAYTTTDISILNKGSGIDISSVKSKLNIELIDHETDEIALPKTSPFANWQQARRFAGPLPFTFSYDNTTNKVLIIEGVREGWKPAPLQVVACNTNFFNQLGINEFHLANAFIIKQIPYWWKKGRVEYFK